MSLNFDTLFGPYSDRSFSVNYNWVDIDSATGYVVYDGLNTREDGLIYHHLIKSTERLDVWSYDAYTASTGDYTTLTNVLDLDFETSIFQNSRKVRGEAFLKVPFLHADATMSHGYIVATLKKGSANPTYPPLTEAAGDALASSDMYFSEKKYGYKITTNYDLKVTKITTKALDESRWAYILDSAKNVLFTASVSGNVATFGNAYLDASTTYYVAVEGIATDIRKYTPADAGYPVNGTNINYTGGLNAGSDDTTAQAITGVTSERLKEDTETQTDIVSVVSNDKTATGANIFSMGFNIPETTIAIGERLILNIKVWVTAGDTSSTVKVYHNPRDSSETGYTGGNARLVFTCPFKIEET